MLYHRIEIMVKQNRMHVQAKSNLIWLGDTLGYIMSFIEMFYQTFQFFKWVRLLSAPILCFSSLYIPIPSIPTTHTQALIVGHGLINANCHKYDKSSCFGYLQISTNVIVIHFMYIWLLIPSQRTQKARVKVNIFAADEYLMGKVSEFHESPPSS